MQAMNKRTHEAVNATNEVMNMTATSATIDLIKASDQQLMKP